ncbi:GCK [Artemisia annua]|uniref:GCK n=1 Tax=Artemisia annua TaxID=35608 RepID=A0A2U1MAP0_ARTAN|nr:GCK [Artemisia annua]
MSSPQESKDELETLKQKEGECTQNVINLITCIEQGTKNEENILYKCYKTADVAKECVETNQVINYGEVAEAVKKIDEEVIQKDGECKETFIEWEECVDQVKKNDEGIVNKCSEVASDLKTCMSANRDYYDAVLGLPPPVKGQDHPEKEVLASKFGILSVAVWSLAATVAATLPPEKSASVAGKF